MAIIYRIAKGTMLTHAELDGNFSHLDTNKEPVISSKGTAFNKSFGTTEGTVADGGYATSSFLMENMTEGINNKIFSATERTKLSGIATSATANSADNVLLLRTNHTGTQAASTISDFDTAVVSASVLNSGLSTNLTISGIKTTMTVGEDVVFGDLLYVKSDGKLWKADANDTNTYPAFYFATETKTANATCVVLKNGFARNDSWTWTVGGLLYMSTTTGGITQTQPETTDDIVQIVGIAISATIIDFTPQLTFITVA